MGVVGLGQERLTLGVVQRRAAQLGSGDEREGVNQLWRVDLVDGEQWQLAEPLGSVGQQCQQLLVGDAPGCLSVGGAGHYRPELAIDLGLEFVNPKPALRYIRSHDTSLGRAGCND